MESELLFEIRSICENFLELHRIRHKLKLWIKNSIERFTSALDLVLSDDTGSLL